MSFQRYLNSVAEDWAYEDIDKAYRIYCDWQKANGQSCGPKQYKMPRGLYLGGSGAYTKRKYIPYHERPAPARAVRGKKKVQQRARRGGKNPAARYVGKAVRYAKDAYGAYKYGAKLLGYGDYRVGRNSSPTQGRMGMGTSVARFGNRGNCTVVQHREYIGDVSSSTAFTNTTYSINPAVPTTFPWLSTIAKNFEEYDFKQLAFQFKSTSADALNSTNTALGTVIGATIYNSVNPAFTSKQQMENYEFAKSSKPSEDQVYPVECAHGENPVEQLYTRVGPVPSGADPRLYDLGTFQQATVGSQAAAVIGELWVLYTVELYKPKLESAGASILSSHYRLNVDDILSPNKYFRDVNPLLPEQGSTLDLTIGTNTITWPSTISEGNFLIMYSQDGIGTVQTTSPTIAATSNCSTIAMFHNGTTARTAYTTGTGGNQTDRLSIVVVISITGPGAVVTMSGGVFVDDPTGGDLVVTQINTNVLTAKQKLEKLSKVIHSEQRKTDAAQEALYQVALEEAIRSRDQARSSTIRGPPRLSLETKSSAPENEDEEFRDFMAWKRTNAKMQAPLKLVDSDYDHVNTPVRAVSPSPSVKGKPKK
nr:putative capsid protein [Crucivirus sp.]